jgi:hypothetical protein
VEMNFPILKRRCWKIYLIFQPLVHDQYDQVNISWDERNKPSWNRCLEMSLQGTVLRNLLTLRFAAHLSFSVFYPLPLK